MLADLVTGQVEALIDQDAWDAVINEEEEAKQRLHRVADSWDAD